MGTGPSIDEIVDKLDRLLNKGDKPGSRAEPQADSADVDMSEQDIPSINEVAEESGSQSEAGSQDGRVVLTEGMEIPEQQLSFMLSDDGPEPEEAGMPSPADIDPELAVSPLDDEDLVHILTEAVHKQVLDYLNNELPALIEVGVRSALQAKKNK